MTAPPTLDGLVPDHLRVRSARILLDNLEVQADIGFHDYEVGAPQRLLVTVEIWLADRDAPQTDDPGEALDYDHVRNRVRALATRQRYNLQETLAYAIYTELAALRGVAGLRVATSKPDIYPDARGVGVEISSHG